MAPPISKLYHFHKVTYIHYLFYLSLAFFFREWNINSLNFPSQYQKPISLPPSSLMQSLKKRSHFSASRQVFPPMFLTPFPTILKTSPICYFHSFSLSSLRHLLSLIFNIVLRGYPYAQESLLLKVNNAKILPRACLLLQLLGPSPSLYR